MMTECPVMFEPSLVKSFAAYVRSGDEPTARSLSPSGTVFLLLRHTSMRIGESVDLSYDCLRPAGPNQWALPIHSCLQHGIGGGFELPLDFPWSPRASS